MEYVGSQWPRLPPSIVGDAVGAWGRVVGASDCTVDVSFGGYPFVRGFLDGVPLRVCGVEPFFHYVFRVGAVGEGGGPSVDGVGGPCLRLPYRCC